MYVADDGRAASAPAAVTLQLVNQAPVAIDPGPVTTTFDTPVDIELTGSDPDGNPLESLEIVTAPDNGTLSVPVQIDPTSFEITYTPGPGFTGSDSFGFRVFDDIESSAPETVQLTVDGPVLGGAWAGGVVFQLDGGGNSGKIASVADGSAAIEWGGLGIVVGAAAQSDTDGAANTAAIVAALGNNGGTPYAAQICNDYEVDASGNTPCQRPLLRRLVSPRTGRAGRALPAEERRRRVRERCVLDLLGILRGPRLHGLELLLRNR